MDAPYFTKETIYNHSKIYIREDSSPSFLKESIEGTPVLNKKSSIVSSDGKQNEEMQLMYQIVEKMQSRIQDNNHFIRSEIKKIEKSGHVRHHSNLVKTIKLK